ncbi:DUF1206 domain-containing protein [Sphingomonas montana]|uniref:DUF1206 domain-containing protein n=1 Tax=Sphingomonas montana TaxID=1843236 RepID=UPI0009700B65|nr:DUF1206 domain-containing protein [Sphingomonas montana]
MTEQGANWLARLGFAARGLVYILVGWFAIDAARTGGAPTDNQAAMASLIDEPFGRVLLGVVAVGLAGYAFWRLTQAAFDPERVGIDAKGAFKRLGFAISGIAHVLLAWTAVKLATRTPVTGGSAPGDAKAQDWTRWLLEQPAGPLLIGVVGLILFVVAGIQAVRAYKASFLKNLDGVTPAPAYVRTIGRLGYAARAVVFVITGWFFVMAGWTSEAARAGGMGQALSELQQQAYGPVLLGIVAAGLFCFGLYSLVEARYRHVRVVTS